MIHYFLAHRTQKHVRFFYLHRAEKDNAPSAEEIIDFSKGKVNVHKAYAPTLKFKA